MKSSNPYMTSLTKAEGELQRGQAMAHQAGGQGWGGQGGGYARNPYGQQYQQSPNYAAPAASADRPMTVDDVVTKTGITLAVIVVFAAVNLFIGVSGNTSLAMGLTFIGAIGGFIAVLVSAFGKKYGSAATTLIYAAFEGLFVGGYNWVLTAVKIGRARGPGLIFH
ncbi:MAG: Bax inhibitor-1/YccA family protein, partial [Corynebacterium nuruki]|nr:Bax inhibitor-1/YccA family protein [Corynebacterium nuruki]